MDKDEINKGIDRTPEKCKHRPCVTATKPAFPDLSVAYKNCCEEGYINPLSANIPKWSETLEK